MNNVFFALVVVSYMEKNLDITKPFASPFCLPKFHYTLKKKKEKKQNKQKKNRPN